MYEKSKSQIIVKQEQLKFENIINTKDLEIEKLKEQIKAGEAFGQNVDELKKKLAELKFADVIESKKKDIEQQIGELLASAALDQITNAIAQNLENQLEEVNKLKENYEKLEGKLLEEKKSLNELE